MVKQIFNWTCGGFFRTLGRFMAFILIGLIMALLMLKNDISINDIFGIQTVYADTSHSFTTAQARLYLDQAGTETITSWQSNPYTFSPSYPVKQIQYRFSYSGGFSASNTYTFKFSYQPTPDAIFVENTWFSDGTNTLTDISCTGFIRESNGYYGNTCTIQPIIDISSSGYIYARVVFDGQYLNTIRTWNGTFEERKGVQSAIAEQTNELIDAGNQNAQIIVDGINDAMSNMCPNKMNFNNGNTLSFTANQNDAYQISSFSVYLEQGKTYYMKWKSNKNYGTQAGTDTAELFLLKDGAYNTIIGSIQKAQTLNITSTGTYYIRYDCNKSGTTCTYYDVMISEVNEAYCKYGSKTSKLDDISDSVNNLDDTIKDDDVNGDGNDMADYISNFTVSSFGLLTNLITLPIDFIEDVLTDNSNTDLCTTFRGKNICLPNGSILWERTYTCDESTLLCDSSSTISSFKLLVQVLVGGYLSYKMVIMLVHTVNDALNPNSVEEKVAKLF